MPTTTVEPGLASLTFTDPQRDPEVAALDAGRSRRLEEWVAESGGRVAGFGHRCWPMDGSGQRLTADGSRGQVARDLSRPGSHTLSHALTRNPENKETSP